MLSQRRRHSRWRMSLIFITFLGLICNGELASANVHESSSSSSSSSSATTATAAPTAKRKSQDIGSLNDFAWQAWILVDPQNSFQHGMDSATLLRRITPKSVFIAPALPACAEGYRADTMGRCVKSVNIDENAHNRFLLDRLNNRYGNLQTSGNKNDQRKSTGPLQLNIPLIPSNPNPSSTKVELEETFSMNDPIVMPSRNKPPHLNEEEKTRLHEIAIANKYKMKNDTILDEKKITSPGNSSTDNVNGIQKIDTVVPVTDFVKESNDTRDTFSELVDYKIPIDLKISLNASSVKRLNANDITKNVSITENPENFTELSPTLILLIPSTKSPSVADDLSITQNENASHVIAQMSNVTLNETAKQVVAVSVSDSALPSADKSTEIPSIARDEQRENETHADDETASESSKLRQESQEMELDVEYDEEEKDAEYSYSTDVPDEEDSVELENEEILRHGEAGMTIPTRKVERLHREQQQQNQTTNRKKTLKIRDLIMIRFNDSMPTEDKDETGSNVSSEVSIDGDLILETTLLDVNTEKLQITTKSPVAIRKNIKSSEDDPKESFGKSPDTEPEVIFSQNSEVHGTTFTSLHGRKRTEHLTKFEDKKNEKLVTASSSSKSLLYNFPKEDPITEIRMIDNEQSTVKESALQENSKDFRLNFHASDFKPTTMNLDSAEDYVKFPDYVKQPQQQDDYVRFPSSEVNSIHSQSYKQHSHHPMDDVDPHDGTSTKSSVPIRQKPVYYLPSWKPERLQTDHVPTSERQKQRPDLLRFWSKMPLVRDHDVYRADHHHIPDDEAADDTRELPRSRSLRASRSRKVNLFTRELSSENVDRVPAQKRRTSVGG